MDVYVDHNQQEQVKGITQEYPYVMHEEYDEDWKIGIPWHWHEELEFIFVVSGGIEVITNNAKYTFRRNEGFFCNSGVLCKMEKLSGEGYTFVYSHLFHPVFLSGHFRSVFETRYMNPVLADKNIEIVEFRGETKCQQKILQKLKQVSLLQKTKAHVEFETRNLFSEIWLLLLQEIKEHPRKNEKIDERNQGRILSMLSFIHQHYNEKLTLEQIAATADVSGRECLRCFQKNIGKSPFEYLVDFRVEKSVQMLKETDESVMSIGYQCGFSSNAYFGKKFKEIMGTTPGNFRKNLK